MTLNITAVISWIRQPTTIAALATLAGTGTALALHQMSAEAALALSVGAAVGLILPDNSNARTSAVRLAVEALAAVRAPNATTVGSLVNDAVAVAISVEQPTTIVVAAIPVVTP